MKVFADYHHEDLFYSLQLLFEKRLGWELYRPAGMEWYRDGYWRISELYNTKEETAMQFLELRDVKEFPYIPPYTGQPVNKIKEVDDESYTMESNGILHRALTLDQFKKMDIDIVIASIPLHFESFAKLIHDHKPKTKLIGHFGNVLWYLKDYKLRNIMASVAPQKVPDGVNAIFYHQEFPLDIFSFEEPNTSQTISSFLHVFDGYPDAPLFYDTEKIMPDWKFNSYGAGSREGTITGRENIAKAMHDSRFIWHVKLAGDGYGHIIHNAFAVGRPPIVKHEYYKDKLAGELMKDGETCIFIDGLKPQEIATKIKYYDDPVRYENLARNAYMKFREIVDFDQEEKELRKFLDVLL